MMKKRRYGERVDAGRYYAQTPDGRLELSGDVTSTPNFVICRRVADYAPAPVPAGAAFGTCVRCGAAIAFNPHGPHQDRPKVCQRCAGIRPLPVES